MEKRYPRSGRRNVTLRCTSDGGRTSDTLRQAVVSGCNVGDIRAWDIHRQQGWRVGQCRLTKQWSRRGETLAPFLGLIAPRGSLLSLGLQSGKQRMSVAIGFIFALSVVYAVLGNVVVFVILSRRRVPMRFMWAGTPTYLYRVCRRSSAVGVLLRRFAASTDVAFVVAMLLAIFVAGVGQQ